MAGTDNMDTMICKYTMIEYRYKSSVINSETKDKCCQSGSFHLTGNSVFSDLAILEVTHKGANSCTIKVGKKTELT